jgi:hypothetical protein
MWTFSTNSVNLANRRLCNQIVNQCHVHDCSDDSKMTVYGSTLQPRRFPLSDLPYHEVTRDIQKWETSKCGQKVPLEDSLIAYSRRIAMALRHLPSL